MKKISAVSLIFLALVIIASQVGCSKNSSGGYGGNTPPPTTSCAGVNPSFTADVLPLIQTKCAIAGCHAAGSTNAGGPFTTFAQISAKASDIKAQVSAGTMPKSGTISASQKTTLICWVNNGALNN